MTAVSPIQGQIAAQLDAAHADIAEDVRLHDDRHVVQFFEDERFLFAAVSDFIGGGLMDGAPVVVIATPLHRDGFSAALVAKGLDVDEAIRGGQLTFVDARETLAAFMVDDVPDGRRFREAIDSTIARAMRGGGGSRVKSGARLYGEMVDLLWRDGKVNAAIQLEHLWNELLTGTDHTLLCAYCIGNFGKSSDSEAFQQVCDHHTRVIPTERYTGGESNARLAEIARLQHRAQALENEIDRREVLERQLRDALTAQLGVEQALRNSEQELRDFLENAAEGIHRVSRDGTILWANKTELELVGYSAAEYVGRNIVEFHADRPVIDDILARLGRNETLRDYEARLRCKDGSIRHVLINSNVLWRDDSVVYTRCFTRDITELKRATAEREALLESERQARTEAEAANRAKSDFLAIMSHELRTPLNAIGGHVQLLEMEIHGPVTEAQRAALDRVSRSQRHLLSLINDVLNLTRIETGRVDYALADLPLAPLVGDVTSLLEPLVTTKGLTCEVHPAWRDSGDRPLIVRADREKVQQILLNLLTNAVKFTPAGGRIVVSATPAQRSSKMACVHVRDTGIGIESGKLETIFEPFVQLDARYADRQEGVGLGLAISRDLARGMGGELTVSSTVGEGTVFTLSLPRV